MTRCVQVCMGMSRTTTWLRYNSRGHTEAWESLTPTQGATPKLGIKIRSGYLTPAVFFGGGGESGQDGYITPTFFGVPHAKRRDEMRTGLFYCYSLLFGPLSFTNGVFDSVPNTVWAHKTVVVKLEKKWCVWVNTM